MTLSGYRRYYYIPFRISALAGCFRNLKHPKGRSKPGFTQY